MKNTATLGQIQKILTFLDGIPSEQVQKVIESGFFSDVIRNGELEIIAKRMEAKRLEEAWKLIGVLTGFKDISITIPHVRYQYAQNEKNGFQLRCWLGEHGHVNSAMGHVDSGTAKGTLLFETRISEKLDPRSCCWTSQLNNNGFQLRCWLGEHGHVNSAMGHVDSGTAKGTLLFETRISEKLDPRSCCWTSQLNNIGLRFNGDWVSSLTDRNGSQYEWVLEDKGVYDTITLHPRK